MAVKVKSLFVERSNAGALIIPFFEGAKPAFDSSELESLCGPSLASGDFCGKNGEVILHYSSSSKDKRVVLLGLGKQKEITGESLRRSYAKAFLAIKEKASSVNIQLPALDEGFMEPCLEGVFLAAYRFDHNRSAKGKIPNDITFLCVSTSLVEKTQTLCKSVAFTRDLVFQNADVVTPTFLAQIAKQLDKNHASVKTKVMRREQIAKAQMGLLTAVSRAAVEEPAFIVIEYKGAKKSSDLTALIGKGITYDTGGLSLKPTGSMLTMRDDMGGAAAVLGTMHALCHLKIPVNVVAVIPSAENAIGSASYKVGDVYTGYDGTTVEVTNTDAEGRLVLADALSYVQEAFKPTRIIDLATLTGAAVVVVGQEAAPLMANSDDLAKKLIEAGKETFERLWQLPLYEDYKKLLESKVADIKNAAGREASSIQGGIFLQHFIHSGIPWAHLDIGGVTFIEDALKSYQPIQATGYGVRLLIRFFEKLCR